jgi:predicted neutral ceramidase superfamily lipid hydrolase
MRRAYHDSPARSLPVRRRLGGITFVAFLFLVIGMSVNYDTFSDYMPRDHLLQWTFFAAAMYLLITYWVARDAERPRLLRVILVQGVLLVTSLAVFIPYHLHYDPGALPLDPFYGTRVLSFHVQLAVPAFLALVLAPWLTAMALRAEPADVRPLA